MLQVYQLKLILKSIPWGAIYKHQQILQLLWRRANARNSCDLLPTAFSIPLST